MTSEDIIRVAEIVLQYLEPDPPYKFSADDEQAILNMYYSKYGIYEQDWQEIAESIR